MAMRGSGLMRLSWLAAPLLLSACQAAEEAPQEEGAAGENEQAKAPIEGDVIECAIAGGQWFVPECGVQRVKQEDGAMTLVVRHPDGGFRRFLVLTDGRGLATADGSEETLSDVVDGRLDVSVGQDRYRFPVTIKSGDDGAPAAQ